MLLYLQMSGAPGSGKTTLARALAPSVEAVVLDHDVTKSALLRAGVEPASAGRASYLLLGALAGDLLAQGHSVIVDSPCLYDELLARGQRLAREARAAYRYIECRVEDLEELDRRLRSRTPLPSQLRGVRSAPPPPGTGKGRVGDEVFLAWIRGMKRPETPYLVVDGMQPLARCVERALAYLRS